MEASFGWRADVSSLPAAGVRIGISHGGRPVAVQSVLNALQTEPRAGSWFGASLAALPSRAFYWECPALAAATLGDPFECVALEAPSLIGLTAEPDAFRAHFEAAPPHSLVAVFPNLSGDAVLVAPKEGDDGGGYPHLADFVRAAPQAQIAAFFSALASQGLRAWREGPAWISTAGDGVAWVHGRVDRRPKYYRYAPYRAAPRRKPPANLPTTCSPARSGRNRRRSAWRGAGRRCCASMS
jgi:hypothetical protein